MMPRPDLVRQTARQRAAQDRPREPREPRAIPTPVLTTEELTARLLHRDADMLILDKPAGLPVHPGTGGGPNLEDHLEMLRFGLKRLPALAHRLDRDTSGCLVLGRHRQALARLGDLFAKGRVTKTYWAVVEGRPPLAEGRIEAPLAKITPKTGWRMRVDPAGQQAATEYRLLGEGGGLAWVQFRPLTGRTHQIRVHAAELGCPVRGDIIYGTARGVTPPIPLHLHARAIVLPFATEGPPVAAQAPPPPHMREALAACGWGDQP